MKKLLTILLALLVVTGVVFADNPLVPDEDTATLKLTSTVGGKFAHWFENTDEEKTSEAKPTVSQDVDLDDSEPQDIGSYNIATNAAVAFRVDFTVNRMKHNSLEIYVPYLLSFAETVSDERFTVVPAILTAGLGGTGDWGSTATLLAEDAPVVSSVNNGGQGTLQLDLQVTFQGDDDMPEGTYSGDIVAEINVI